MISREERRALRSLTNSTGWKVYSEKLRQLVEETREYVLAVDDPRQFYQARGHLNGVQSVVDLVENLFEASEKSSEEILESRIASVMGELEKLGAVNINPQAGEPE